MPKLLPLAALLALAATRPALAQAPAVSAAPTAVPAAPTAPTPASRLAPAATTNPATPNSLPPAAVPAYPSGYADKHLGGSTSGTFPNGVPVRDIDNGTGRADQPRANQAQAGAQPTRSIFRSRKRRGQ